MHIEGCRIEAALTDHVDPARLGQRTRRVRHLVRTDRFQAEGQVLAVRPHHLAGKLGQRSRAPPPARPRQQLAGALAEARGLDTQIVAEGLAQALVAVETDGLGQAHHRRGLHARAVGDLAHRGEGDLVGPVEQVMRGAAQLRAEPGIDVAQIGKDPFARLFGFAQIGHAGAPLGSLKQVNQKSGIMKRLFHRRGKKNLGTRCAGAEAVRRVARRRRAR